MSDIDDVLAFWLGDLDDHGKASPEVAKQWWAKDPDFDQTLRDRFAGTYDRIVAGEREDWLDTPRGTLAYVIVLDQLSRNMFRDSGKAFAADAQARRTVHQAIERGHDQALRTHERYFLYMPLMHSESLDDHAKCRRIVEHVLATCAEPARDVWQSFLDFQQRHARIVERFGRYPHRNALLGRESTDEERTFLEQPGSSF